MGERCVRLVKGYTWKNARIGSSFDDFLKEDGIYEEVSARASSKR